MPASQYEDLFFAANVPRSRDKSEVNPMGFSEERLSVVRLDECERWEGLDLHLSGLTDPGLDAKLSHDGSAGELPSNLNWLATIPGLRTVSRFCWLANW